MALIQLVETVSVGVPVDHILAAIPLLTCPAHRSDASYFLSVWLITHQVLFKLLLLLYLLFGPTLGQHLLLRLVSLAPHVAALVGNRAVVSFTHQLLCLFLLLNVVELLLIWLVVLGAVDVCVVGLTGVIICLTFKLLILLSPVVGYRDD